VLSSQGCQDVENDQETSLGTGHHVFIDPQNKKSHWSHEGVLLDLTGRVGRIDWTQPQCPVTTVQAPRWQPCVPVQISFIRFQWSLSQSARG
jgi:hypothetical protein